MEVQIPCGQCIGCRLERSRQWAIRCMHEASLHDDNCFITLTYADEHLPPGGTLRPRDFQLFMKRLRKKFGPGIRFFQCGEYGAGLGRPHHHALLFGHDFEDKVYWTQRNGQKYYVSADLMELWPFGWHTIGNVTFESAAYTARYIMKKINGDEAEDHYGEKIPEYITMSRRPGIAKKWYDQFKNDVYPHDYVIIRDGIKCRPPAYYDKLYDLDEEAEISLSTLKIKRLKKIRERSEEYTPRRLQVKEEIQYLKAQKLPRPYEEE